MSKLKHTKAGKLPTLEPEFEQALTALRVARDQTEAQQLVEIMNLPGTDELVQKARRYAVQEYQSLAPDVEGLAEETASYSAPLRAALEAVAKTKGRGKGRI